jgi:Fibronectin type III-like domain
VQRGRRAGVLCSGAALADREWNIPIKRYRSAGNDGNCVCAKGLIGWARVELAAGESKQVSIPVSHERLTIYDEASDGWKLVPGNYTVMAGGSSQELPLQQQITLP